MVMATTLPAVMVNFNTKTVQAYHGLAIDRPSNNGGSMGLQITSTGFQLQSSSAGNSTTGVTSAALNEMGTTYVYVAYMP